MKKSSYTILLKSAFVFLFLGPWFSVFAQELQAVRENQTVKVDSLYREDQFYISVTYNLLRDTPEGFSKSKFSTGFSAGFLRDMPINKERTVAIASGIGFTYNNYNDNIGITGSSQSP